MMQKLLIGWLVFFIPLCMQAQRFGGTPPAVKWKQINTDSARIIFPAGLESNAQRIAQLVHYQAAQTPIPLGDKIKKIDIVLQNQTTIANGYVGLGPFRSEFYLTPATDNFNTGSLSWADLLAIHEYRHVQQFNNFRNGLSNVMYHVFGEEGYSLAVDAAIPNWFYEGDAVHNETVLSKQGRGRLPLFMNAYPALWQAGKKYSWMKLRNGSFKDYVPDHYKLGYLLVNYGYEKYGDDFWGKVTRDATAYKGLIYPFQKAIKKYSGVTYSRFYTDAFDYYKKLRSDMQLKSVSTPIFIGAGATGTMNSVTEAGVQNIFPVNKQVVTNYLFPYQLPDGELLYLKSAYNKRSAFYRKDAEGEHKIRVKDISIDDQFSYRNGKVVYAAYENDKRWRWRDYSVIKLLDVKTGAQRTITHRSKYFTPDISASGNHIAAVEISADTKSELHILNAADGSIKKKISSGEISLFTDPKFLNEDTLVTAVRLLNGQMALAAADIATGSIVRLTPPSFNVVGYPCISDHVIYFTGSYGGKDNIFAIKPGDKKIYQLSNAALGNYFVNVADGKMVWSNFTAEGYQLQQTATKNINWTPVSANVTDTLLPMMPVSEAGEVTIAVPGEIPARNFIVSDYKKGKGVFNFHSWRPYYEDPEFTFSVYGENVLNTLQTQLYYLYNQNDRTNAAGVSATFGALFPYLGIGTQYTFGRQAVSNNKLKEWDQLDTRIGFTIPLSWASNRTYKQLNAGTNYYYRNEFNKGFYKDTFTTVRFSYLQHFINWSQQVEMTRQDIFPRWGYSISADHRHAITSYSSYQFLGGASVYLPGIVPSHSIVVNGAYQETDTLNVLFSNQFAYSRGYNVPYFSKMWRLSANYHFPVVYPDWGFGNILYLQRIRGNAFYDFTKVFDTDKTTNLNQRSTGGEIYIDTKWWNQYELSFGFRVSYLQDKDFYTAKKGNTVFEFILPVSILPR